MSKTLSEILKQIKYSRKTNGYLSHLQKEVHFLTQCYKYIENAYNSIEKAGGSLTEFKNTVDLIKDFISRIEEFIKNPNLATAKNLKKLYIIMCACNGQLRISDVVRERLTSDPDFIWLKLRYNDFFQKTLNTLIVQYNKQQTSERIKCTSFSFNSCMENIELLNNQLFEAELYKKQYGINFVGRLNQGANPIIGQGLCAGIALYGVYQSLKTNQIKIQGDLLVLDKDIHELEKYHHVANYCGEMFGDPKLYNIVKPTKLSFCSPLKASIKIANQLKIVLQNGNNGYETPKSYGLLLTISPNSIREGGHAVGISITESNLFFIDANFGVFKFALDKREEFCNFIGWFLYTVGYCQYFNKFTIQNFAAIENEFSTPLELQVGIVAQKNVADIEAPLPETRITHIKKVSDNIRDKANELCLKATIIAKVTFSEASRRLFNQKSTIEKKASLASEKSTSYFYASPK